MWPWEHLAFGYLLYSGYTRSRYGDPPTHRPTVALAVMTQLPDIVDKPLAWSFEILPGARSLAHSLFTAAIVIGLGFWLSHRYGNPAIGHAVAFGYGSHLLGDIIYSVLVGGSLTVGFLLWPVVQPAADESTSLLLQTSRLFSDFLGYLQSSAGHWYIGFEVGLLGSAVLLWIADGRPGIRCLMASSAPSP